MEQYNRKSQGRNDEIKTIRERMASSAETQSTLLSTAINWAQFAFDFHRLPIIFL